MNLRFIYLYIYVCKYIYICIYVDVIFHLFDLIGAGAYVNVFISFSSSLCMRSADNRSLSVCLSFNRPPLHLHHHHHHLSY